MSAEPAAGVLPRNFLRPCLLLLLREEPAHGYDLLQRLRTLGFVREDPGGLYRALRALEEEGLVHSAWEHSAVGPARRRYTVTRAGVEELHRRARGASEAGQILGVFLSRYAEWVELRSARAPVLESG